MKKIFYKIILLLFIALVFCSENEKYTFIYSELTPGIAYMHTIERELSFNLPGIGLVEYAAIITTNTEYLGEDGNFSKYRCTLADINTEDSINGIAILDYYWQAIENKPCILYVDGDDVDHIKPVYSKHDFLMEAFEQAHMGIETGHFIHPFGEEAVDIAIGDSWTHIHDSTKFYVNMGSPPSYLWENTIFTLRKVKNKKGKKIAYVDAISETVMQAQVMVDFHGVKRLVTGKASGESVGKFQYDIENTRMLYVKSVTELSGDLKLDGKPITIKMNRRHVYRAK